MTYRFFTQRRHKEQRSKGFYLLPTLARNNNPGFSRNEDIRSKDAKAFHQLTALASKLHPGSSRKEDIRSKGVLPACTFALYFFASLRETYQLCTFALYFFAPLRETKNHVKNVYPSKPPTGTIYFKLITALNSKHAGKSNT